MGGTPKVAIATAAEAEGLDEDEPLLVDAFGRLGILAVPAVWDDAAVDWYSFAGVVVRSTWDYPQRREEFLAWAHRIDHGRLWNPADVLSWNTDKTYLEVLADAGMAVVPTSWVGPDTAQFTLPRTGEYVVKPAVSAGSKDTVRYRVGRDGEAVDHVRHIQESGRTAMVQPYLGSVDSYGETALLYVDGRFSHAVRKGPLLAADQGFVAGLFAEEEIAARQPTAAERALADAVVAVARERLGDLLYARVDVVAGADGAPLLLELELAEPSLFLAHCEAAADTLAAAVAARLS